MIIPSYPAFESISIEMRPELHKDLCRAKNKISELTFANIYLFRKSYDYKVSRLSDNKIIISGQKSGEDFFMLPMGLPENEILEELFNKYLYLKCLPEPEDDKTRINIESQDYCIMEDRDNFDYVYCRKDLANLAGKKFHKKRNLVNTFINNYSYEERPLTSENIKDAFFVLDKWKENKNGDTDYTASLEALKKMDLLQLKGCMYYVNTNPAGYTLGEGVDKVKQFLIHFEKALEEYKGIYQFINKSFASALTSQYHYINREQDLGEPGLRQAKMSYRPSGFIKKYRVYKLSSCPCPKHFPTSE